MKNLNKIFEIEEVEEKEKSYEVIESSIDNKNQSIETDYDHSRRNLYDLLNRGQEALEHAIEVAKQSEHPRAFEVVGNLMKQLSEINHDLVDLHTKKVNLKNKQTSKDDNTTQSVTNNAIFVGSTAELSNFLQNMRKEK